MIRREWQQRMTGLWTPDYSPKIGYPCCCTLEPVTCVNCEDNTGPGGFLVTLPALTNESCEDCADLAEDYLALYDPPYGCYWLYYPVSTCNATHLYVRILEDGGDYYVAIDLSFGEYEVIKWEKNYGASKPDCVNMPSTSIPYSSCEGLSPTCSTTLPCLIEAR